MWKVLNFSLKVKNYVRFFEVLILDKIGEKYEQFVKKFGLNSDHIPLFLSRRDLVFFED